MRVITQTNPFTNDYTTNVYEPTSIIDLYSREQIDVPIEQCMVLLNDTFVDDYAIVPRDGDTVIFKTILANEDNYWAYAVGGLLLGAGIGAAGAAIFGGSVTIAAIAGGLYGASYAHQLYQAKYGDNDSDSNYTLQGSENESNQYGIVPVVYGTTKYAPTFGASDYTEYVDTTANTSTYVIKHASGYGIYRDYTINGTVYEVTGTTTPIVADIDAPLTISHDYSKSLTIGIYDYDSYKANGNSFSGLTYLEQFSIATGKTITITEEALSSISTVGTKDVYLHQLYVLGYTPTVVENVYFADAPLLQRKRTEVSTATFSGSTITATGAFTDYVVGERILVEYCTNRGEYVIATQSDNVITVDSTLTTDTSSCTISHLELTTTFDGVEIDYIDGARESAYYPYKISESNLSYTCSAGIYQYYTTPSNVSEVLLNFGFLSGLYESSSSGKLRTTEVSYVVEYKKVTDETYTIYETLTSKGSTSEIYYTSTRFTPPEVGTYDIRVKRTTDDVDADSLITDKLTWISARTTPKTYNSETEEYEYIDPIEDDTQENLVCLALRIKATDQISGSMSTVYVEASRWMNDYDVDTDSWIVRNSSNPASVFIDILTNDKLSQHPIEFTDTYFDMDSFKEWHQWCDATSYDYNGTTYEKPVYSCDGLLSSVTTVQAELINATTAGRASFTMIDGKYSVLIDKPRDAVQMFTSRNIIKDSFSVTRSFDDVPDGVSVSFTNSAVGYITDEIDVTDEYTTSASYTLKYIDNYAQAYDIGRYLLNSLQYQILVYTFQATLDALIASRGDHIILQHDAALAALSSGRVQTVVSNGGLLTALVVDEPVIMDADKTYGITVRGAEGFETYKLITTEGTQYIVYIDDTISDYSVEAGDLFSFGIHTQETVDLLVCDISYDSSMHATISATPYSEEMYDTGEIPEFTSNITIPSSAGTNTSVDVYQDTQTAIEELIATANNPTLKVFQEQPIPAYNRGSIWLDNTKLYDCVVTKTSDGIFEQSDWRLRSSSTFDILNKDTFNEASPEHRWAQIPGGALAYNLLTGASYTVTDGDATKELMLIEKDDDGNITEWESLDTISAVTVDATDLTQIIAKGNMTSAHVLGRYENSGYMGETYENLLLSPVNPSTQDVVVGSGTITVQCYRGTIETIYGTASYNEPLQFTSAGETLTLTISSDCKYGQVTETDFIPPYVDGVFTANSGSETIVGTDLQFNVNIVNIPEDSTKYSVLQAYGDASNYISIYLSDSQLFIEILANGADFIESYDDFPIGDYTFILDWSSGVTLTINGVPREYTETGNVFGTGDDGFGVELDFFGVDDVLINFTTALTTANIGLIGTDYFNNTFTELVL